jgi:hypothetical protein
VDWKYAVASAAPAALFKDSLCKLRTSVLADLSISALFYAEFEA